MKLFNFFRSSQSEQFETIVADLINEANHKKPSTYGDPPYHQLENVKRIQKLPDDQLGAFIVFLVESAKSDWLRKNSVSWSSVCYHSLKTLNVLLGQSELPTAALEKIALSLRGLKVLERQPHGIPGMTLLLAMQRAIQEHGYTSTARETLKLMLNETTVYSSSDHFRENNLIMFLLQDDPSLQIAQDDQWGPMVISYLRETTPELCSGWVSLFAHCKTGAGKPMPSGKWLKEAEVRLEKVGHDEFAKLLTSWLGHLQSMLQERHRKSTDDFLRDENHEVLKGLIWCVGIVNLPALNSTLEDYAVWAYKKLPGVGSISVKTGTAAMFAFSMLPLKDGVARLSKFRMRVKNNSILKAIDKILKTVSDKHSLSMSAMEELAVPDFGIVNGELNLSLDYWIGIYSFTSREIIWQRGDKTQKSIAAELKVNFATEIKAFKKTVKEAEEMLPVIKKRMEESYLQQRVWEHTSWYKLYIDHPLTSLVARKLVWHFTNGERKEQGIFSDRGFINVKDQPITWLDASTQVQLWHPIGFPSEHIVAWRDFFSRHQIVQPFKQAYREVYIVTGPSYAPLLTQTDTPLISSGNISLRHY